MHPEELLAQLALDGISISRETLRRWVNAGLVSAPVRENNGRGLGKSSKYTLEACWETWIIWHLLKETNMGRLAEIRKSAIGFIPEFCLYEMENHIEQIIECQECKRKRNQISNLHEFVTDHKVKVDSLIFKWTILDQKVKMQVPASTVIDLVMTYIGSSDYNPNRSTIPLNAVVDIVDYNGKRKYVTWHFQEALVYARGMETRRFYADDKQIIKEVPFDDFIKETPDGRITIVDSATGLRSILSTHRGEWFRKDYLSNKRPNS